MAQERVVDCHQMVLPSATSPWQLILLILIYTVSLIQLFEQSLGEDILKLFLTYQLQKQWYDGKYCLNQKSPTDSTDSTPGSETLLSMIKVMRGSLFLCIGAVFYKYDSYELIFKYPIKFRL